MLLSVLISLYTVAFIILRGGELAYIIETPVFWISLSVGYLTLVHSVGLSKTFFTILCIICMIWIFDVYLYEFPQLYPVENFLGKVIVVTGANSGTGLATALEVAAKGGTVYLGCRSRSKCLAAESYINSRARLGKAIAVPEPLDLAHLDSVAKFTQALADVEIDILLNNAGFAPEAGAKPTANGFEPAFGSMHMGHFYLTKLILGQRKDPNHEVRVVNVASGTHYACLWYDCLHDLKDNRALEESEGEFNYWRSKLANVLHAWELKNKYNSVTSYSVNLGFVATNITIMSQYGNYFLQRSPDVGVRPILYAMSVIASNELNGYIVDGTFGISKPLSDFNIPLAIVFYGVSKFVATTEGLNHIPRSPFSEDEAKHERLRLWQTSEHLLKEALAKS